MTRFAALRCLSIFPRKINYPDCRFTPYYISTPTIQVQTKDEDKYGIVEKLTEEFKSEGYRVIDINGARI